MYARIEFTPVQSDSPCALARFAFSVPLGDGVVLSCRNGTILRSSAHPDALVVAYPRAQSTDGKAVGTWAFCGNSQTAFDRWVLDRFQAWLTQREVAI